MARTQISISEKTIKKFNAWKKGIVLSGQYKPYLTVRDVNKIGRRHWLFCPKQKRQVHLLSDGESRAYKKLISKPSTVIVEEQFALDIDETLDIAVELNLIHPRNWKTNLAYVMTTDFVATYRRKDRSLYRVAYTFKYWDQIYKASEDGTVEKIKMRTWQKFEIERQYWLRRGVQYRVITEHDATKPEAWNFDYFELAHDLTTTQEEVEAFGIAFIDSWVKTPRAELQQHFKTLEQKLNTPFQRVQSLFQYACLYHFLPIKTDQYIRVFRPVELSL